jgi:hypothetical protein
MSQPTLFDSLAAEIAAEKGKGQALEATRVQAWKLTAAMWLNETETGTEFTADDLIRDIGLPDQGVYRNNVVGAIFSAAARRGAIRFTGRFRRSERVIGHGNLQRVWVKA